MSRLRSGSKLQVLVNQAICPNDSSDEAKSSDEDSSSDDFPSSDEWVKVRISTAGLDKPGALFERFIG
ncbi:hypothetical protein [Rhodohalobacter sp. SW132]|uniref:hypothetical protein n=1 Tax=Rhodohalobacter sp. SW132 TaxID=2293433 RepID=UPI0011C05C31|nr:hypothetical protein [Rhodohalobacter sp. SW132]